ncbi:MAG: hypothetical protein SFX18_17305 [Pirellulales bacterium]|nr:hypothetical protein [Pirellulales bacterium]
MPLQRESYYRWMRRALCGCCLAVMLPGCAWFGSAPANTTPSFRFRDAGAKDDFRPNYEHWREVERTAHPLNSSKFSPR